MYWGLSGSIYDGKAYQPVDRDDRGFQPYQSRRNVPMNEHILLCLYRFYFSICDPRISIRITQRFAIFTHKLHGRGES